MESETTARVEREIVEVLITSQESKDNFAYTHQHESEIKTSPGAS